MTPGRLFALNITDHPEGGSQVGVIAKRTYRVRAGACTVADEQVVLVEEPQIAPDLTMLLHDMDIALNRKQADIIVSGYAYPRSSQREFDVRVRVGPHDRGLRVFGARRCWKNAGGQLRFSLPEVIQEPVEVGWTSAYGGVDEVAMHKYGDPVQRLCAETGKPYNPRFGMFAYPRNRAGKGYLIEPTPEALEACELPNLEDLEHPLSPERFAIGRPDWWPAGPMVASLGWLSYNYFPRSAMLGFVPMFDPQRFLPTNFDEVHRGALNPKTIAQAMPIQERLDIAVAQQSAIGMRAATVTPGAPVLLMNLHPHLSSWVFKLPTEVPAMALQLPDAPPMRLTPQIRTVLLQAELDQVCITWVGEQHEPHPVGPGKMAHIRFGVKWDG